MKIGTTFDFEQAESFGINYKKALKRIIELKLTPVRIGIKWSRVEGKKQRFNWKQYDEILHTLKRNRVETILQVGMKSPRWPEFFIPDWQSINTIKKEIYLDNNDSLKINLFNFIEKTINRYKSFKNISSLQIENEPFLKSGPNKWRISDDFLYKELSFARKTTDLPILLTAQGLPTTGLLAEFLKGRYKYKKDLLKYSDTFGLNVFPRIKGETLVHKKYIFKASKLAWEYLHSWLKKTTKLEKALLITELQAEPWSPHKWDFKDPYAHATCNPDMVKQYLRQVKAIGFEKVLIWGTEFHLKCEQEGNSVWIEKLYNNMLLQ